MQSVYASGVALGVPQPQLRWEFFGPLEELKAA
jgi:nitric oxide dioxygenase